MNEWQTGRIKLESLGIEVELKENQRFSDDGFVPDLEKHLKKYDVSMRDIHGCCIHDADDTIESIIIVCSDDLSEKGKYFTKAHEETHALNALGKAEKLYSEMKKLISLPKDEERIADLAGIFALSKRYGASSAISFAALHIDYKDFLRALKIALKIQNYKK